MNWLNILLYIPHCRYGVPRRLAVSIAKVMAKSLRSKNLLYNALFRAWKVVNAHKAKAK